MYLRAEYLLEFLDFKEDNVNAVLVEVSFKRKGVLNALLTDPRISLTVIDHKGEYVTLHLDSNGKH